MKIIFVGDKPSNKNFRKDIPFWGTKSYTKLLSWIGELQIHLDDVAVINRDAAYESTHPWYRGAVLECGMSERVFYVALGDKAEAELKKWTPFKENYYKLDHPSGLNRKLNDKQYEKEMLNGCKRWLREQGYYPKR